jgi:hypothetical protein
MLKMKKVALFVLSIAAMVSYAAAFSAFSAARMPMLGARKPARMRCARTLSMQYEKLSEQEFAKLVKEVALTLPAPHRPLLNQLTSE